ncbi:MAG TPA: M36 family metallopeptidase [Herpetosiphonaceae bacterium]
MPTNDSHPDFEAVSSSDMQSSRHRRRSRLSLLRLHVQQSKTGSRLWMLALTLALVVAPYASAFAAQGGNRNQPVDNFQGEAHGHKDRDARRGTKKPTAQQEALVSSVGGRVRWNEFGTPAALSVDTGVLASGLSSDPVAAAREYIRQNRALYKLSEQDVANLELINNAAIGAGNAVLFQQRFGNLPTAHDGMITVGVANGQVTFVSSSIAGSAGVPPAATIAAKDAVLTAAADAGHPLTVDQVTEIAAENGYQRFSIAGFTHPAYVRLAALPTPQDGVRSVWDVTLMDNSDVDPLGITTYVDAQTGAALVSEDLVDYLEDDPRWRVFPTTPPLDYSTTDTRELWCASVVINCDRDLSVANPAPFAWDINPATGTPTYTTLGNNARSFEKWNQTGGVGTVPATPRPDREYTYAWTNQWQEAQCNPDVFTSPTRNDIDAALANLFAVHNQMHDWSYHLGFTEQNYNMQVDNLGRGGLGGDPEQGNAQAGGIVGGPPSFAARNNANQNSPRDGLPPTTNMYLWQPNPAIFYGPCVDGDYDMTVIGHEYTHAISNRMVAGPNSGLTGDQAGAMGESWSDLVAVEQLNEYGWTPAGPDANPWAVGSYVTSDKQAGIRNYGMNNSPLNYSDIAYDVVGEQVHADGEIWSATNFDIMQAMVARYNAAYPASDDALQASCANGDRPVEQCPGNRRWVQLVFDAWLLMANGRVSMVDARDAMLAADRLRFGGANQDLLWNVFASRGLGKNAFSDTNGDADPIPSFESDYAANATVRFLPQDGNGNLIPNAKLYIGHFEARAMPVADTDPATTLTNEVRIVPGTYDLIVQAPGYGMKRASLELKANQVREFTAGPLFPNVAASVRGATASGDGTNQAALIDETEATNWASLGSPVAGKQVTVRLDPSQQFHTVRRVQVSAMLRPAEGTDADPAQNRYSALRQFEILTCQARSGVDCSQDSQYVSVYTSPADAFPAVSHRPRSPHLILRSFDVTQSKATHVRLKVVTNQCTGGPDFIGEKENDPRVISDCITGSDQDLNVRAAELQVFTQ